MRHARGADITATLLRDGRVLVASGWRQDLIPASLQSAEIYEPNSGIWSPTMDMAGKHLESTATLLMNGTVLVTGRAIGSDGEFHGSSEIFDPATGLWSPTEGQPSRSRSGHSAVRLSDGRVLVVGGREVLLGSSTRSLVPEIYNPSTGGWSSAEDMATDRIRPVAILLTDGRVLVAGGSSLSSAELYDPVAGEWSGAASMSTGRVSPKAMRLQSGKVLVVGGTDQTGNAARGNTSVEIYDPIEDTWSTTGSIAQPGRWGRWIVLLRDGRVLAGGGGTGTQLSIKSYHIGCGQCVEIFDPGSDTWSSVANMNKARFWGAAALLQDGKVLVVGGIDETGTNLRSAEIYDPATDTWTLTTSD